MSVELVTSMDIGDVHLEDWPFESFQRVKHCNKGERISRRVNDQRIGISARCLNKVDQHAFVIRLMKDELRTGEFCELLAARFDCIERGRAVDMRLTNAQQV